MNTNDLILILEYIKTRDITTPTYFDCIGYSWLERDKKIENYVFPHKVVVRIFLKENRENRFEKEATAYKAWQEAIKEGTDYFDGL